MSLLQASIDNQVTWFDLPTPAPENYYTTKTHVENSYINSAGYLNRDIIRKNRHKVFCGYNCLDGNQIALLDSLYDYDYFYLRYTDNQNYRRISKVYAGPLDSKAKLMDPNTYAITLRTSVQINFVEY